MAINLKSTRGFAASGVKLLVYGQAGSGKTTLIKTLPNPVILSAEAGLLSLHDSELPFIEINSIDDITDAYVWLTQSDEAKQFDSVAIDSISELAEVCLTSEKATAKDPRQAYGEMQDQMAKLIRSFRDLPGKHVYMSAKLEKSQDEMGRVMYAPAMPGNKTGQALPYFFDEVLALRCEKDAEGNVQRALLCQSDGLWQAKDRSGRLAVWESPDLNSIISKIERA
jgi:phage nucleotide-binding protein